jgi:hypothetical protein
MFPVWMPPELKAHLIEMGIPLPPPAKPRDPVSDASARDGVIRQHVPAPGQEPNF